MDNRLLLQSDRKLKGIQGEHQSCQMLLLVETLLTREKRGFISSSSRATDPRGCVCCIGQKKSENLNLIIVVIKEDNVRG